MYPVPQTRAILKTTWTGRTLNPWSRSAAKDLGLSFFSFHHCAQHCVPSTVAGMGHCGAAPSKWKRPHVLQKKPTDSETTQDSGSANILQSL